MCSCLCCRHVKQALLTRDDPTSQRHDVTGLGGEGGGVQAGGSSHVGGDGQDHDFLHGVGTRVDHESAGNQCERPDDVVFLDSDPTGSCYVYAPSEVSRAAYRVVAHQRVCGSGEDNTD